MSQWRRLATEYVYCTRSSHLPPYILACNLRQTFENEQELRGFPTIRQAAATPMWRLWASHPTSVNPYSWVPFALRYYDSVAA